MFFTMILVFLSLQPCQPAEEVRFNDFFEDKVLRVDLHFFGTHETEKICIDELIEEPFYAGPKRRPVRSDGLGSYRFNLYDAKSGTQIFSRGFCTLFGEWRTTEEAHNNVFRVFEHVLIMPYPKKDVVLAVSKCNGMTESVEIFRQKIVMDKSLIRTDSHWQGSRKSVKILSNGSPKDHVDLVILGDGYTAREMKKFVRDARKIADELMAVSPLKESKSSFNINAIECPSLESGVDEPRKEEFRSTAFELSFNTFGLARYPLSMDIKSIHDAAACVPYDYILIIYNSPRYGGGGIYNLYAIVSGKLPGVIAHEFGHLFGGLADEYFTSPVTYIDFYPDGVEPWEPNITALLNPEAPKWKALIKKGTPVPTPNDPRYFDLVGCFEGAGYRAKGLYRPFHTCIMLTGGGAFCPVCRKAILSGIRFHLD